MTDPVIVTRTAKGSALTWVEGDANFINLRDAIVTAGTVVTLGLNNTSIKTANYTASVNDLVNANSSSGAFNITLPTSPADGSVVGIVDVSGTYTTTVTTPIMILPGVGSTIQDEASFILDVCKTFVTFIYVSATSKWMLMNTPTTLVRGTGLGSIVYDHSPTLITPNLGTPSSLTLTYATGLPYSSLTGTIPTWNQDTTGSASIFTSTTQNSQFNSIGVGTAASNTTGEIRATNSITQYYSDERLKDNITNIPNALDKVIQLNGVTFTANDIAATFGYTNKSQQVGVIAQQVELVLPEIVVPAPFDIGKNEDGSEYSISGENYKTVQYEKLVPLLIEAIKELTIEVNNLKCIINTNKQL